MVVEDVSVAVTCDATAAPPSITSGVVDIKESCASATGGSGGGGNDEIVDTSGVCNNDAGASRSPHDASVLCCPDTTSKGGDGD